MIQFLQRLTVKKEITIKNILKMQPIYDKKPSDFFNRKQFASAADRNKEPILEILKTYIPLMWEEKKQKNENKLDCLEISSGSGQHVTFFAKHFPYTEWQPSEYDTNVFGSIRAYIIEDNLKNVQEPIQIDASSDPWPILDGKKYDIIYNANLLHISPKKCTPGLFKGAGNFLKPGGILFTYGAYAMNGIITPESNQRFDQMLKSQDPEWGLRDINDLKQLASKYGITLEKIHDMPANNKTLIWRKSLTSSM